MITNSIENRIKQLRDDLNYHNHLYYVMDQPVISDHEFDKLMNTLINLEKQYPEFLDPLSPTHRVGGSLLESFESVKHLHPMLSLSNTYSQIELSEFDKRVKKTLSVLDLEYVCELKYDGVAISLIYENGVLIRAVTRGDGVYGDNVTENIKTIKTIPLQLFGNYPSRVELRGEVYISKKEFAKINDYRKKKQLNIEENYNIQIQSNTDIDLTKLKKQYLAEIRKFEQYSNPRNFASGSLKLLDSSRVAKRNLDCVIYSVIDSVSDTHSHHQLLLNARSWGFKISENIEIKNSINGMMDFINKIESNRNSLDFEIDGVVIKVNSLSNQKLLSHTSKSPRWAISYKFKSQQVKTHLKNITYQVGRTGAITPVAELDSIYLSGSFIQRASLHNSDFIKKLDLKIGDIVIIEKGGDVIPKVVAVDLDNRNNHCKDIVFITHCPSCANQLKRVQNEANYYCMNSNKCLPQRIAKVEHFISREALNIHTLGVKTIKMLFVNEIIQNVADLFLLDVNSFTGLKGFGEKSQSIKKAQNIINGIKESVKQPFEKVLYALGIRYVGKTVSKKLAEYFGSIERMRQSTLDELLQVDEIGDKIANSIVDYFNDYNNNLLIKDLQRHGLQMNVIEKTIQSNKLQGLVFVVSGTFKMSREEVKKIIDLNGGKNTSSLSKNTSYLIAGKNMGPKKKDLALSLDIPIISEMDFQKMIE